MWIEIDENGLDNFKELIPAEELYRIGRDEDYMGIGYARSLNTPPLAAIVFKTDTEEDEEGDYPIIDIKYFAVVEEARRNGVFSGLYKEFLDLVDDDFIGLIRADIPLDNEYDVACATLEEFGFEFVLTEKYEFIESLSKCRKNPVLTSREREDEAVALKELSGGQFKELISELVKAEKLNDINMLSINITDYNCDVSTVILKDGKAEALVLVKGPYGDMLDVEYAGGEGGYDDIVAALRKSMRLAADKYGWSERVRVKIKTDEGAALLMKIFPDARPLSVRRGYLYPEIEETEETQTGE